MNTYIENSKIVATISDAFITDSEFKELVYGLGMSSDTYLRLSKKGDDRVYYALREWCKAIHTVNEFIQVLKKIGYHNLITKLGYSLQPTRQTLGQLQNEIYNNLTTIDKQSILTIIGLPIGRVDSIVNRGSADFWAALSQYGKISEDTVDLTIWKAFPMLYQKLKNYFNINEPSSNTMNNWTVKQIAQLANDAAAYWESVAAHLNIEPSQIKASVHAGATPRDYSRKLFECIQNRCMSEDTVRQALIACGNKRLAEQYFGGSTFSAPGGVVVGSFSGGSITLNNSCSSSFLSPYNPQCYIPDNPDFDADENNLYARNFSQSENPFNFVEKKETMSTFVNSNSPLYTKLCGIMDENGDWKTLAKNYGVLNNPAAAKLVLDLSAGWEKRQVHPTDRIFKLLIATPHGQRSLDQLSDDLLRIDNPQIVKWVNEWNGFRQKQDNAVKDTNTSIYNANVELRQFLLQHKISKSENVDSHLARLTQESIGVSEPEHLKMMEYNDFIAAGFNVIESKMFCKAIATLS